MTKLEIINLIGRLRTYAKVDTMSSEYAAQMHICWIAANELEELLKAQTIRENLRIDTYTNGFDPEFYRITDLRTGEVATFKGSKKEVRDE